MTGSWTKLKQIRKMPKKLRVPRWSISNMVKRLKVQKIKMAM